MPENLMDQGSGLDIVGRGRFCVSYFLGEKETQNRPLSPPVSSASPLPRMQASPTIDRKEGKRL